MPLMPCFAFSVTLTKAIAKPIKPPTSKAIKTPKSKLSGSLKAPPCCVMNTA